VIRLFVALNLPLDIKSSLSLLKAELRGAQWVPSSNLHLTIRFIGEVNEQQLQVIKEELREVSFFPFSLRLKDLGHFSGRSGPNTIWVGVDPKEDLLELRTLVDSALLRAKVPLEKLNFKPHVTLAKLKGVSLESLVEYFQAGMGFYTRKIEFNEMVLISSKLRKDGPVYSEEEIFKF
jgi:RNA 2',3'-cyclic 3'-phosphodiesterase